MRNKLNSMTLSFLSQIYSSAHKDYQYALNSSKVPGWDWVIITAATDHQAYGYREQLNLRAQRGLLPINTKFAVIPDKGNERIGSGGATLSAIKHVVLNSGGAADWKQIKILVIHSGGDSKRIPQYSVCGKLFAPILHKLDSNYNSTLFDEVMALTYGIPSRASGGGLFTLSGDTLFLFNPIQIELRADEAAALSCRATSSFAKNHGVFLCSDSTYADNFLHKMNEKDLMSCGAVGIDNQVALDTGHIWLGGELVESLSRMISDENGLSDEKCDSFINSDVSLSFYADFIYPMSCRATLECYLKQPPERDFSKTLEICRHEIWKTLSKYKIKVLNLFPAKFIHIGNTKEAFDLAVTDLDQFSFLGWQKNIGSSIARDFAQSALYNTLIGDNVKIAADCYLENCSVGSGVSIEGNSMLSNLDLADVSIPANIVIDGLVTVDKKHIARIYGINDNPKASIDGSYLGITLRSFILNCGAEEDEIWSQEPRTIWNAAIFPICDSQESAINSALCIYRIANGKADIKDIDHWRSAKKTSFMQSAANADSMAFLVHMTELEKNIRVDRCLSMIDSGNDAIDAINELEKSVHEEKKLIQRAKKSAFPLNMRIYSALALLHEDKTKHSNLLNEKYENQSFSVLRNEIINDLAKRYPAEKTFFVLDKAAVRLPLRVNFCSGPSDAAPYCIEHGGNMLNAAILLNNDRPICASVECLEENTIILSSEDQKICKTIHDLDELISCSNPMDSFALHKAVMIASGVISKRYAGKTLGEILKQLGGGIRLTTITNNIPKGSGLGTSSILSAACIKALHTVFGIKSSADKIYAQVFLAEQLMTTGGGWQDQVGGLTHGFKYVWSKPGIEQQLQVETLELSKDTQDELDARHVLIFSGQRRLARNVLRKEMNRCIGNHTKTMLHMKEMKRICALMKYELENGNVDEFASLLSHQFEIIKHVDSGASNSYIEYIFDTCSHLISGKSICGAGGGGFLQVILKRGITKQMLGEYIQSVFTNCNINVWDSSFVWGED